MFIRFHRIHESDRQTDRQTPHDGIGRAYAYYRAAKMACEQLEVALKPNCKENDVNFFTNHFRQHELKQFVYQKFSFKLICLVV